MMAERGVDLAHTTILRWVLRYVPEFEKKWNRFAHSAGTSWRVDETYIRVRGEWKYLYRAVDKQGNTVDFLLSQHRDIAGARRFFVSAIEKHGAPEKITLDGYAATHTAVRELKESAILPVNVRVRTSKYINNIIEQDHRRVKRDCSDFQKTRSYFVVSYRESTRCWACASKKMASLNSYSEAAGISDAGIQEVRECGSHDQRDRVDTQDQKGAI
jgi:transposase-like protein